MKPRTYVCIVVIVATAAGFYAFRERSLFACQPANRESGEYIAYCGSTGYGDYDYGAFWFDLEPTALEAAKRADVLFVGNSRLQFAFSSEAVSDWFSSIGSTYYLLGFAYEGNYRFAEPLLRKLEPQAKVYIIDLDAFFEPEPTPPARVVMYDSTAQVRYERKKRLQHVQGLVCSAVPAICGRTEAFYRMRRDGRWNLRGGEFTDEPVSFRSEVDSDLVRSYVDSGREFLDSLPVPVQCQFLTITPTVDTEISTAEEIADSLSRTFLAPELSGLGTFDSVHLDSQSADLWSMAFLVEIAPHILECFDESTISVEL